ncbi:MAG: sodium/hydrogen exchanger family/TrkA domain protein [Candidatus Binatia bacterium]|nr:MAG: sodium/hydrogen exchanger family/TrkA domain protein [Candidatus Binatia bacterium]
MLADVVLLLAVALGGLLAGRFFRLPPLAAYLLVGVLAGPGGLGLVARSEGIEQLAELGVALLLFGVGIEFSLARIRRAAFRMLSSGTAQVLLTTLLTAAGFRWLGTSWPEAVAVGFLVSLSSTALVLKLYSDRGEVDAPHAQAALGVLLLQDLALVPMMLLLPVLSGPLEKALEGALLALAQASAALVLLLLLARVLLPRFLAVVARMRVPEVFSLAAVLFAFGTALVAARFGLSLPLGAFLAGLALSGSPFAHQVFAELLPLRDAFMAIFFTSVGLLFEPRLAAGDPVAALAMLGFVVLKGAVSGATVGIAWRSLRIAVVAGFALAQIGEFSFVLAWQAAAAGLLSPALEQAFFGTAILTMAATPWLLEWGTRLGRERERETAATTTLSSHVVIVGLGHTGQAVARVLRAASVPFCAVDIDPSRVEACRKEDLPVRFGDATRRAVLQSLGIERCRAVVVAVSDPVTTRRVVSLARQLNPAARILVRTQRVDEVPEVERLGADEVIPAEFEASIELFVRLLQHLGVPRNVARLQEALIRLDHYQALRGTQPSADFLDRARELIRAGVIETAEVMPGSPAAGRTLAELAFRRETGAAVLALVRGEEPMANPDGSVRLREGDVLVLYGPHAAIDRALELLSPKPEKDEGRG